MKRRQPRGIFVQPTTHEGRNGNISLRTYPATRHGLIESFVKRTLNCRMPVGYKPRNKQDEEQFQREQKKVREAYQELNFDEPLQDQVGFKMLREMNVKDTVALDASRQNEAYGYHGARD